MNLLEDFVVHLTALNRSQMTITAYRDNVKRYLRYLAAHGLQVVDVDCNDLEKYQGYLLNKHCVQTADVYMRAVKAFYKFLLRENIVRHNPVDLLHFLKLPRQLPRNVLTESEVTALLDAPDTNTDSGILFRAILETYYSAALRISELCNLKINDADTARGFIRVNHGKGGRDRVVPIGNTACLWIRVYRELVRPKLVNHKSADYLFLGPHLGYPIKVKVVASKVGEYGRLAGVGKRVTSHVLRHTCASHLLKHGASLLDVKGMLGHELIETTQKYTRINQSELIEAHKKFHPREADEY